MSLWVWPLTAGDSKIRVLIKLPIKVRGNAWGRTLAKSCATVRRETHSPELNAWAFVDTHSPFQADAADGSALEWTMNNCPGSWGHYHLCLTNATAHTTVQHKQSRLLVHKPFKTVCAFSLAEFVPCLSRQQKLAELPSVCFASRNKCIWEKGSLWVLLIEWSFCKGGSQSESPTKWNSS